MDDKIMMENGADQSTIACGGGLCESIQTGHSLSDIYALESSSCCVGDRYSISDLIDIVKFTALFEEYSETTGFSAGLVSIPDQNTLIATGKRRICTEFHRIHPDLIQHCVKSDQYLTDTQRSYKGFNIRSCMMGLFDAATSVIIQGVHVASLFTGQVFCDAPDLDRFGKQAKRLGFDVKAYLEAVKEIPIVSENELHQGLSFLKMIASMIAEQGLSTLEVRERAQAQKLESLGVLAGGMAHDFNNLLTAILGNAELTMMELTDGTRAWSNISEIKKATLRASELCQQMLVYSGRGSLMLHRVRLTEVVQEMAGSLDAMVTPPISIQYDLAEDSPWVEADPSGLGKALKGLVSNAAEAIGPSGGTIHIRTHVKEFTRHDLKTCYNWEELKAGSYACIEVEDSGCGMDPLTQTRIFDPFFSTKFPGRGLEMAAILGMVRSHKGAIKVHSELGEGSVFTLLFPILDSMQLNPVVMSSRMDDEVVQFKGKGTLLLVDDEKPIVDCGKIMLEKLGFQVLTASNGLEAITTVRKQGKTLICVILDLTMPCMDGEDAFDEIHKIQPGLPVIISSGYSESEIMHRFTGKKVAGIIQKPFLASTLQKKLRTILEGSNGKTLQA